jgi:hypothetical protein
MILRVCDIPTFIERVKDKKVFCFGAGRFGEDICRNFPEYHLEKIYTAFTDSNPKFWGQMKILNLVHLRREVVPILSLENWRASLGGDAIILITAATADEIIKQLESYPETENVECYAAPWLEAFERDRVSYDVAKPPKGWRMNSVQRIPKMIHYIWIGNKTIPPMNQRCVESWRKFCPDYEIKLWNEKNYDFMEHPYARAAYNQKKWGFVSDYSRLDIIYNYGGIYMDCDVELLKPLDELLYNTAYAGMDFPGNVNFGLGFGSIKGLPLIKEMRDEYDKVDFEILNKEFDDSKTCVEWQMPVFLRHGLKLNPSFQIIEGMAIYPAEFFSPRSWITNQSYVTQNSYSIHYFDGSWKAQEVLNSRDIFYSLLQKAAKNEEACL